jgi:YegS/Rv2252/BmrU family lipid kinase
MGHKALLIYNPAAGPWEKRHLLKRLSSYLKNQASWTIDVVETKQPGDATRFSEDAAQRDLEMVIVAGGDGTVNEVANGLVGSDTALAIAPVGTGNILAHQLQMPVLSVAPPFHVAEVGNALLESRYQRVDVGKVGDRHFVCWAGIGLDAEIAAQMEPRPRYTKRLRALPYIIAAFSVAFEFRGVRTRVQLEERSFNTRALLVLVSNIQLYAVFFKLARHACMDDGIFDVFVFKGLGFGYVLRHLLHISSGRYLRDPAVVQALARHVQIETSPEIAMHVDGEPYETTPAAISLLPGALRLVVPPQAPHDLFCKSPERSNLA